LKTLLTTVILQLIVNESNRYAQQEISKASGPLCFDLALGSGIMS
jgi:hypothetical protein